MKKTSFLFVLIIFAFMSCDTENFIDERKNEMQNRNQNQMTIDNFFNVGKFMPANIKTMTSQEKNWFENNAVFDIKWRITGDYNLLSEDEKRSVKASIESILKAINYTVFTAEFTELVNNTYLDGKPLRISKDDDGTKSVKPITYLLALRALNTRLSNHLTFKLVARKGAYTAPNAGRAKLIKNNDRLTLNDFNSGFYDHWEKNKDEITPHGNHLTMIVIPIGERQGIPRKNIAHRHLLNTCDKKNNPLSADTWQGFNNNLIFHELLHAFFKLGHATPEMKQQGNKDFVYTMAAAYSVLVDNNTNGQTCYPSVDAGTRVNGRHDQLVNEVGGHLPFASVCNTNPYYASYNIVLAEAARLTNTQIYNMKGNSIFPTERENVKRVPNDPYQGINWGRMQFLGWR